jgi:putative addiction module antidote
MMRQAGGSVSVTIPKDLAERYHMVVGEPGFAIETDQGLLLTTFDPNFENAMKVYARGAKRYRNALRELSKK